MNSFKTTMQRILSETVQTEQGECSRMDAIAMAVVDKAMKGDLPSINFIRELSGKRTKSAEKSEEIVRVRVIREDDSGT